MSQYFEGKIKTKNDKVVKLPCICSEVFNKSPVNGVFYVQILFVVKGMRLKLKTNEHNINNLKLSFHIGKSIESHEKPSYLDRKTSFEDKIVASRF